MDREFQEYKTFCLKNGLKECCLDSLNAFYKDKNKKSLFKKFKEKNVPIQVVLPMTVNDRINSIEDYYMWADNKGYSLDYVATFIEYQKYLNRLKFDKK